MGKKTKKKTIASTRKQKPKETARERAPKKEKKANFLKSLKPQKLSPLESQKLKGVILIFVGSFALIFSAIFLWNKLFRPQPIPELLPADSTVGFVEVNIDGNSAQPKQLFDLLKPFPAYQKEKLIGIFDAFSPFHYQAELSPWLGRKMAIALMKSSSQNGSLSPLLLIESKDLKNTMAFFEGRVVKNSTDGLVTENYRGVPIYSYKLSQNFSFFIKNNYVIIASAKPLLTDLIEKEQSTFLTLQDEANFRKVSNNLPQGSLAFAYVNMPKLFTELMQNPAFASQKGREFMLFQPFLKIYAAIGMTVFAGDQGLNIQTFSSINRDEMNGAPYLTYNDKYQGSLLSLADEKPVLLMAGHDLFKELNRLEEIFKAGTKASAVIVEGALEYQKEKYLGKDISLSDDIYPLLKGEYLISFAKSLQQPEVSLALELKDPKNDLVRIEKIVTAFTKISAIFEPQIREVTLPDGTRGEETVASPEQITRGDETYQNINVTRLKLGAAEKGISYAVVGSTLVVSTDLEALHRMMDRSSGQIKTSLKTSNWYREVMLGLFQSADQLTSLNLDTLFTTLNIKKYALLQPYLEPWKTVTSSKNFFDDGISDIYIISTRAD